jgi:iron complex outermembrane receptor protein
MNKIAYMKELLAGSAFIITLATAALAENFDIPGGDLKSALSSYTAQTGVPLLVSDDAIKGVKSRGAKGDLSANDALLRILTGTGFTVQRHSGGAIAVVRDERAINEEIPIHEAAASAPTVSDTSLETVTVTSSKIGSDVQNIPISISAFSQEQLTATQTTGGPDLVKDVPNLTFTKTNFSGYSINIRGIGTQAISVTTDPAVAVAFNDIPFIRNHFFEQEFYDVSSVEVLRGPQGTLYGRNATSGVINVVSAKPSDQFEASASIDLGNYGERRLEGMINVPIVDDRVDIRVASEWTKRNGYVFDESNDTNVDGRDLWSGRMTIGWKPFENLQTYFVWEHFSEDDDRLRSGKQLCKTAPFPATVDGAPVAPEPDFVTSYLSQGCEMTSLYSPGAFEVPNGFALPVVTFGAYGPFGGVPSDNAVARGVDPYASATQSTNLRVIQSALTPRYQSKNDTVEINTDYGLTSSISLTSQTGFNHDFLYSTEDLNRFDTQPGIFNDVPAAPGGVFCDPQLGCSNRLVAEDLSDEHAWQLSQEFRAASNFSGPFNFNVGVNYLHYETEENFYVFNNLATIDAAYLPSYGGGPDPVTELDDDVCSAHVSLNPAHVGRAPFACQYIDPNPLSSINSEGHNYFVSKNPYVLNSYSGFGEAYYQVLDDVKLTAGLRWTDDRKHFVEVPSETLVPFWGYPISGTVDQQWQQFTGRFVANWTPKLDFTDQTLFYASYSRGYKAGGANPPGPALASATEASATTHPLTFAPEFVNAYEAGTKNTLLDGTLTLNGDVFYYDYKGYQISQIVDRTSINLNFNANIRGAEAEATWEPIPGLRFNFAGGYEDSKLASGSQAIDLIDRTAGNSDWMVIKPFINETSNCILPTYVVKAYVLNTNGTAGFIAFACDFDYTLDADQSGTGFDPKTAPNGGAGFDKSLTGNQLPNAPPFTVSFGTQYTIPVTPDWGATLRGDYYWQDYSWARIFNDHPYDRLRGYTNVNLSLTFTNQSGWQVMGYMKNIFDVTAITGAFLYADDVGLTTNVFLTDPRLVGIRVTKNW